MALTIQNVIDQLSTFAPNLQVCIQNWLSGQIINDFDVWNQNGNSVMYGYSTPHSAHQFFSVADTIKLLKYDPDAFGDFPVNHPSEILHFIQNNDPDSTKFEFLSIEMLNGQVILNAVPIDYL